MTKAVRFLRIAVPLAALYLLLLAGVLPVPLVPDDTAAAVLPVLPWWLLVSFGAYSLTSLGLGLLRFHDTPEAYESLLGEVQQAKNQLRDQGVEVD